MSHVETGHPKLKSKHIDYFLKKVELRHGEVTLVYLISKPRQENPSPDKTDKDPLLTLPTLKLGEVDRSEPPTPKSKQPETSTKGPSQAMEGAECKPKRPAILDSLAPVAPSDQTGGARGGGEKDEGEDHDEVEASSETSDSEQARKPRRKRRGKPTGKAKSQAKAKAASTRKARAKSEAKADTEDKPKRKVRAKSADNAPMTEDPKGKRNADVSSETPPLPRNTRSRRAKAEARDTPTPAETELRSKASKRTKSAPAPSRASKAKKMEEQEINQKPNKEDDKEALKREKNAMRSRKCCAYAKAYKMSIKDGEAEEVARAKASKVAHKFSANIWRCLR